MCKLTLGVQYNIRCSKLHFLFLGVQRNIRCASQHWVCDISIITIYRDSIILLQFSEFTSKRSLILLLYWNRSVPLLKQFPSFYSKNVRQFFHERFSLLVILSFAVRGTCGLTNVSSVINQLKTEIIKEMEINEYFYGILYLNILLSCFFSPISIFGVLRRNTKQQVIWR